MLGNVMLLGTLNCLRSVGYHMELRVVTTFYQLCLVFYQVSYVMFFDVHTKYLCSLSKI